MTDITFRSDMKVSLVQHMGCDLLFAEAARQSAQGDAIDRDEICLLTPILKDEKLIQKLISQRHTSPFEHSALTVAVECPLFVSREWERHRTQSYSEMSLRYTVARPEFWIPTDSVGVKNAGTKMRPFRSSSHDGNDQHDCVKIQQVSHEHAWRYYQQQIELGVAEEVARSVLPLGTYTRLWATANLVNWLKFLSLRTNDPSAAVVSYPQYEIEQAARQVESIVSELYPITYAAWVSAGRVL